MEKINCSRLERTEEVWIKKEGKAAANFEKMDKCCFISWTNNAELGKKK